MKEVDSLFQDLMSIPQFQPNYHLIYRRMSAIFLRCLDFKTRDVRLTLSSPFAKTDYLLKEVHANGYLRRTVNDARVRFRSAQKVSNDDLKAQWLPDLTALCLFISKLYANEQGDAPIPQSLSLLFPPDEAVAPVGLLLGECLRVVVNSFDNDYLYVHADSYSSEEFRVSYVNETYGYDWHPLQSILHPNSQLNLIRPRLKEGVIRAELMIFEPDYLVNVTSISSCFESYAHSPLVNLINKLKPETMKNERLALSGLLGSLASQLFEEAVFNEGNPPSYAQSIQHFFSRHALELLAVGKEALSSGSFHQLAQQQQKHIQHVVKEVLPQSFQSFDPHRVISEASFFSEMLGIQGRMDFLQDDHRILIEQKSGKGNMDRPAPQLQHAVQMFLYMLLIRHNYRDVYKRNHRELFPLLLYSRYPDGLISIGESHPQTVFEAICLRNELVAQDMELAQGAVAKLLESLPSADCLNTEHLQNRLWTHFQKPELDALLDVVHKASALEKAYFYRFFTFLSKEQLLGKIGYQTTGHSGFADRWNSTLEEKLQAGTIFAGLKLLEPTATSNIDESQKVQKVVVSLPDGDLHDVSDFRRGDVVLFYPYPEDEDPDVRRTMVFRCVIQKIATDSITLSMIATQPDERLLWEGKEDCLWAIEHDLYDSSASALYGHLYSLLCAPQSRRDLLLLQRRPEVDNDLHLEGDYKDFNPLALRVKQARDFFLIIGPPGTGKTSYGLVTTLQEELCNPQASVLLMAYTNRAVDEICSKLLEKNIDFIRFGKRDSCDESCRDYLLEEKAGNCSNIDELEQLVSTTRVFVGTSMSFSTHLRFFRVKQFSLAIIDEASQILEPYLLGLLSVTGADGCCAIRKFVMIGDHKQLPAVVMQTAEESKVDDSLLHQIGLYNCRQSLFERLLRTYQGDEHVVYMLNRQGRMHHQVAMYPNEAYYQGLLREVPLEHQLEETPKKGRGTNGIGDLLTTRRVAFVDVDASKNPVSDKVNVEEARCIAATVASIYKMEQACFEPQKTVGVIVPYRNQIAVVRKALAEYGEKQLEQISIDTVERYQGSQRDYIIYGFTVQQYYQLDFLTENVFEEEGKLIDRKLNVAMTRAKKHLLMFGNASLINNEPVFRQLTEYLQRRQCFFSIEVDAYVQGRFSVPCICDNDEPGL